MSLKIHKDSFHRGEISKFNKKFMKNFDDSDVRYFFEDDIKNHEHFKLSHNELPFLPGEMNIYKLKNSLVFPLPKNLMLYILK